MNSWRNLGSILASVCDCRESKNWTVRGTIACVIILIALISDGRFNPWMSVLIAVGLFLLLELILIIFHDGIVRLYGGGRRNASSHLKPRR